MRKQSKRIENKKDDFVERTLNYLNHREKTDLHKFGLFYDLDLLDEVDKNEIIKEISSIKPSKSH